MRTLSAGTVIQKIGPLLSHFGLASYAKKMPNLKWHELKVKEEAKVVISQFHRKVALWSIFSQNLK